MQLHIRSEGFRLTGALDDFVRDRLHRALDRYRGLSGRVHVRLRDDNGPRGGEDKRCTLHVEAQRLRPLRIEERDADLYAAIGRGAQRLERQLARGLDRQRTRAGG